MAFRVEIDGDAPPGVEAALKDAFVGAVRQIASQSGVAIHHASFAAAGGFVNLAELIDVAPEAQPTNTPAPVEAPPLAPAAETPAVQPEPNPAGTAAPAGESWGVNAQGAIAPATSAESTPDLIDAGAWQAGGGDGTA